VLEDVLVERTRSLVGDLDGRHRTVLAVGENLLDRRHRPPERFAEHLEIVGERGEEASHIGDLSELLDTHCDLDQHLGKLVDVVTDDDAPVGRLAPRRPVEAHVSPDAGRSTLAGEAVGRFEAHVTEEDVDLEALLDGLPLEERAFERPAEGAHELGEHMVDHGGPEATVLVMADHAEAGQRNPWLERRVIGYAHQGGAWEGPSSTLFAIGAALDAGATGIELDVHATRDRHLVVCHDATVDRTTDGHGAIASLTLAEVRALDNAYRWAPGADITPDPPADGYPYRGRAPADRRFGIATLEEVLDSFPGVVLNLDIKQTAPAVEPYEAELADLLRRYGRVDDVIVASFADAATDAFHELAPDVATSAGTLAVADFYRAVRAGEPPPLLRHVALQVPVSVGELTIVDQSFVEAAHAGGVAVHVWTIEEEEEMERLVGLGVDGIITDRPSPLTRVLDRLGCRWPSLATSL